MPLSKGKQFEAKIRADFIKIPSALIYRLPDQFNGHKLTSQNPCDFFGYVHPTLFMLEAKSINGNTFPLVNFTQYAALQQYANIYGVRRGIILWFLEHDRILYVPVKTVEQMIKDGKKSINIRTIDKDGYDYIEIPSKKKRVFLDSDYSVLLNLPEGW